MNQQIGNEKLPLEIERRKLGNRRVEKQKMKTGELFAAADKAGGKPKSNKAKKANNKPSFGPSSRGRGGSESSRGRGGSRGRGDRGRGGRGRGRA